MNKLLFLLIVLTPFFAAKANDIVVIDFKEIMRESTAAKDIRTQIEAKRSQFQKEISAREGVLRKNDQELMKQKAILSPDAFEAKRREFQKEVSNVQREVQMRRVQLDSAYNKAIEKVQVSVDGIVRGLADDMGFDLALPASQVIFASDSLNLTKEVMAQLNKQLPKVAVVIEEVPKK
jgi:outer membrane protein